MAAAARLSLLLPPLLALFAALASGEPAAAADPAAGAPQTEEDGVLVLTEANFEQTVKGTSSVLVMFYAPWCGHCKQFAPEFAAAAAQLKAATPPVLLAKMDATVEHRVAEEYGVRGYPTIRLFLEGKDQEYTGGRTEQNIVAWTMKKVGPPLVHIPDAQALEKFERENSIAVVAALQDGSEQAEVLKIAARQVEDVVFGFCSDESLLVGYQLKNPGVAMFFPHDEKVQRYEGDLTSSDEIVNFVKRFRHPLVATFTGDSAPELFGDGRPILILFRDRSEADKAAEQELRKAAVGIGRGMLMALATSTEPMDQRLMDYVAVEPEDLPTFRILTNPMATMAKYRIAPGTELTEASITQFARDFEAGKLEPHMRSEEPPATQPGPVFTLVGSTFERFVKDPARDVLVEFYAPWCGHCKKLEPVFNEVAKRLEGVSTLLIAKVDATANDVPGIDIEGFPTIKLWRANKKDDPLDFDGDRDVDGFIAWLEQKATHPLSRDDAARAEL